MKRFLLASLIVTVSVGIQSPTIAQVPSKAKVFSNCTALNKVYPGGVSKSSKVTNKGGKTKKTPKVSASIYNANKSKDRDKDGIACEM